MFKKTMVQLLVAIALVAAVFAGTAIAQVIPPPGLAPGSEYQILLVTSAGTSATSSDIADYNSFVTQQADQSATLKSLGATWSALGSTPTFSATNASSTTSIPIYDTHGDLLEPNFPSLFTDMSFEGPAYNQLGAQFPTTYPSHTVWTGVPSFRGTGPLGSDVPVVGAPGPGFEDGAWISGGNAIQDTYQASFYAISSPITVPAPEPTTLTLLGPALLGLGVVYLRRRGTKA